MYCKPQALLPLAFYPCLLALTCQLCSFNMPTAFISYQDNFR